MARRALDLEEVRALDMNSIYLGVPTLRLMENAGIAVAKNVRRSYKSASRIAVICGRGNNGGDGFVAARYLSAEGLEVSVFLVEPEEAITTELAKLNYQKIAKRAKPFSEFKTADWDVIIDAMLGVGIKGAIREPYKSAIKKIRQSRKPIISVDVPSGWPGKLAVKPTTTVTFHAPKAGMSQAACGKIVVADIGIPEEAERFVGPGEFVYYSKPDSASHKGDNGRILVIGGGPFTGAPALSGMGAMFSGADLAHVAVPVGAAVPVACYTPIIIVHPLSDSVLVDNDLETISQLMDKCDAVVIGPGLGDDSRSLATVAQIIKKCRLPMVIDADALKAVKKNPGHLKGKKVILTPHRKEFEKLAGVKLSKDLEKSSQQILQAAKRFGVTIIVKGPIDIISDGKSTILNRTGNEGMTVGGTGDVLAGIAGCLLSKGMNVFHAARLATFINGAAGDIAFQERGYGLVATDVAESIPYVLRRYL